jgi:hypothetical protein
MVSVFYGSDHSSVTTPEDSGKPHAPQRLDRRQQDDLIAWVQVWHDAGCAVHPAKVDGSKYAIAVQHGSPDIEADTFPDKYQSGRLAGMPHPQAGLPNPAAGQHKHGWGRIATGEIPRLTPQQITAYIRGGRADGIGVFCGLASGGLLMLEAEGRARSLLSAVRDAAVQQGSLELLERLSGCVDESPSGGLHFYLRVIGAPTPGNTVLAARPAADGKQDVLFETRGQGGWSVVAPSAGRTHKSGKPYRFLRGGPSTIPEFSADELERLYAVFRAVDERPVPEPITPQSSAVQRQERPAGDILPGDDFNLRASWEEILTGWHRGQVVGDRIHWTRPGKDHGTSATTTDGVLCCFSTSVGLPVFEKNGAGSRNALSKFATYAHLNHAGDFKAAARELWNQGYGSRRDDLDDGGEPAPPEPRPAPTGQCRTLDDWRQEAGSRRAAVIGEPGTYGGGRYLDRSPTGAGKTHATISALRLASSSLTVLPTHANVGERVAEMRAHGVDAVAYPELNTDTCQEYERASHAQSLGLVAGAAVCPGCNFKDTCDYRAGVIAANKATHRVATHERLRRSEATADGVQVVVIDETPETVVAPTLTVTTRQITPVETLAHAIRNHWYSQATPDQKRFAGAMLDVVAAIHAACSQITTAGTTTVDLGSLDHDIPENWQRLLYDAIGQVGADGLTAEAMTLITRAATGGLTALDIVTDCTRAGRLFHYVTGAWQPELPGNAAVVMLDATGDAADIEAATGQQVIDCTPAGHLPTVRPVVQLTADISRGKSVATVAGVVQAFLDLHPEVQRLGIIGHQPHVTALIDQGELGAAARQRVVKWCYFGQGPDRASNDWHQTCDHLLVLGTPRANPGDHRRWLVQHGLHEAAGRADGDWGPRPWESVTTDGRPVIVDGMGYRDPDWHRAYVAVSRSSLHQAVGRGRAILPDGIPVTVVTSDPTPYPVGAALDVQPAAMRDTVEIIRRLGQQDTGQPLLGQSAKSPIEIPYSGFCASGAYQTGVVLRAVMDAAGIDRRAAQVRLTQCRDAGMLVQPRRGWWAIPDPSGALPPVDLPTPRLAAPAILEPLRPAVVIEAVPPEPQDDAVQIVSVPTMPAAVADPPAAPAFDDLLELVAERAAIMEYDGGLDRETADRLAQEAIFGRDAVAPSQQPVQLTAGVDHAPLHARGLPLVAAALERFPGTVSLPDADDDPFPARSSSRAAPPGTCRCGHDDRWVQVPIHAGRSVRVDCGHCDRFGWFGVWYGRRLPPPGESVMVPSADDSPATRLGTAAAQDRLSFSFLPTPPPMPTGPALVG